MKKSNSYKFRKFKISNEAHMKLQEKYNDPNNYFDFDVNPVINKKKTVPRFDKDNNLINYSLVGSGLFTIKQYLANIASLSSVDAASIARFERITKNTKKISLPDMISKNYLNIGDLKTNQVKPSNSMLIPPRSGKITANQIENKKSWISSRKYDLLSKEEMNNIFDKIQERIQINSCKNNSFIKSMPKEIQKRIMQQEKNIKSVEKEKGIKTKTANYLGRVTNKNKDDLLMFKNETFRMKNEIKDISDFTQNNIKYNHLNSNSWILSLRSGNKVSTKEAVSKDAFNVNIGSENHPFWQSLKRVVKPPIEIIRSPKAISNDPFEKNAFNKTMSFFKISSCDKTNFVNSINPNTHILSPFSTKNLEDIDDIYVEGKNLLKQEKVNVNELESSKIKYYNQKNYEVDEIIKTDQVIETIVKDYNVKSCNKPRQNKLKNDDI